MDIAVITLFPEMFEAVTRYGVTGKAISGDAALVNVRSFNPRDYTQDRHRTVDDRPYGGGPGMVMKIAPLEEALLAAKAWLLQLAVDDGAQPKVVYMSPQGQPIKQATVQAWAGLERQLILIAGRYEGVDERFIHKYVDTECSVGDYVLSGGELPAMVLIDAMTRLLPGALGAPQSAEQDSFSDGLLDCPHYTRPEIYNGEPVPEVLMSGDHKKIANWRRQQALGRTAMRRPDIFAELCTDQSDLDLLALYKAEHNKA